VIPRTPPSVADRQRSYFRTGATLALSFRLEQLGKLRDAIASREAAILEAVKQDLGRPAEEAYTSEIGIVRAEIDVARKRLAAWARPRKVRTPLLLFPAASRIHTEPYGSVLIIAPWNYPFQLAIAPLVGALAAGNCAVLKPAEAAPHTSRLVAEMIGATFDPDYVAAVEGGAAETRALLEERFDYLFFTGGTQVGRIVMSAAAQHLTPVTLELGGKNPCIVDRDADLEVAARRIAWGKFINAGQTCVAPDYVLVHESEVEGFVAAYGKAGGDIALNLDALYEYMCQRLMQANASNKPEWLDEVSRLLGEIRSAWLSIPQSRGANPPR